MASITIRNIREKRAAVFECEKAHLHAQHFDDGHQQVEHIRRKLCAQ
jgi:hypothetical protein